MIDSVHLPFSEDKLKQHFAVIKSGSSDSDRHVKYYLQSAERYHRFQADHSDRRSMALSDLKTPCQIEKDERFWVVAALMRLYHDPERVAHFSSLLVRRFGSAPPCEGLPTWKECLDGKLHLYFEVSLPSPPAYKRWLKENLEKRQIIPYIQDASLKRGAETRRSNLEGPTHVDAVLLNEDNGFAVLIEAKVLSDCSYQVSFDTMRNQIARNIDVMLEHNHNLPAPLNLRNPDRTLFALLTPQLFRDNPHSRLYGWLMNDYQQNPSSLQRDLPHREDVDWAALSKRLGWLTWEDCEQVLPGACPWLAQPNSNINSASSYKEDAHG